MFGVFFEDINFAADGGLYPELVKNRSFEFTEPLYAWRRVWRDGADGELTIRSEDPLNAQNPHYLRLRVYTPAGVYGLVNSGFRGMGVHSGAEYVLSAYVRTHLRGPQALSARLTDERDQLIAEATLTGFTDQWKRYEATLRPAATHSRAQLELTAKGEGEIDIDMVSLYPKETWRDRPNGLRKDLVQLLADMKPGFIRFPGGCIVEGRRLELRYAWKKTVGELTERKALVNRWNDEFSHRPAPDYFQSFGLGFFEYFQLAEDVGATPLPIVNCGMACQFNSAETAPLGELDPFVQDALDLIAFANGPVESRWGKLRAQMRHPAPFNLKMVGIGNEQWGPRYVERYKRFAEVLKKAHPEISLISSSGPGSSGKEFDYLWTNLRQLKADIVDEHYYMAPSWFLSSAHRYDGYDRSGPKVFAGEYAAQTSGVAKPDNRNNWEGAIAEAAFMTGLERNADVVTMASYAPLFAHVDAWQWTPNLIWFDNLRSFGTPNYYVQKLYATNLGHARPARGRYGFREERGERPLHQRFTRSEERRGDPQGCEHDPGSADASCRSERSRGHSGRRPPHRARERRSEGREQPGTAETCGANREARRRGIRWLRSDAGAAVGYGASGQGHVGLTCGGGASAPPSPRVRGPEGTPPQQQRRS
jgi:alpha-N-arabinofuranosidase